MTDSEKATIYNGLVPYVSAGEVSMTQSAAGVVVANGDVDIRQAGTNALIVSGNVSIRQGGSQMTIASGNVAITQGGTGLAVGRAVQATGSTIGMAVGRNVSISEDSRVIFAPGGAAAFGVGVAVGLFILGRTFRR
ncbi:hypothetical protein MNBD_ACTINO02-3232 [hydrothermal vent metagenome]|uniref:Uncharacterized protein n=1 Tax=hydrothermal vent metagenome TaxID=652676 RepID=A0A3B0SRJ3_9ZZZZ